MWECFVARAEVARAAGTGSAHSNFFRISKERLRCAAAAHPMGRGYATELWSLARAGRRAGSNTELYNLAPACVPLADIADTSAVRSGPGQARRASGAARRGSRGGVSAPGEWGAKHWLRETGIARVHIVTVIARTDH